MIFFKFIILEPNKKENERIQVINYCSVLLTVGYHCLSFYDDDEFHSPSLTSIIMIISNTEKQWTKKPQIPNPESTQQTENELKEPKFFAFLSHKNIIWQWVGIPELVGGDGFFIIHSIPATKKSISHDDDDDDEMQ